MPEINSYRDLLVWQRGMDLVADCYALSRSFPHEEDFVLKLQLRRAAVSVPSNIAEGHGRTGIAEYLHHLSIAHGSLMEVETQLMIAVRLCYVRQEQIEDVMERTEEMSRMLKGLMRQLRSSARDSRTR